MKIAQLLLLFAAAGLSACQRDAGGVAGTPALQATPSAPVAPKPGPTAAEQTAGMVDAVAQGKSALPVELKFELTQRPKVGQALDINLALLPQIDASPAVIKVSGGDDLNVASEATEFEIPAASAGQIYRQKVNVTPAAAGVLVLNVSVSLKHDEVTDLKSFSVPIIADR